jgi:hypothetical protein
MYFTFEHECDNAPMTLEIYVEYSIWKWDGTYDQPAELEIKNSTFTLTCGGVDMTKCIMHSLQERLIDEIEQAVTTAIWENYNNQ